MQKYVQQESFDKINKTLKHPDLPPLTTLRQGVIVLSRQWKNMLYNPMLFEHQYKNKLTRPMNVTFAVPQSEEVSLFGIKKYAIFTFKLLISYNTKKFFRSCQTFITYYVSKQKNCKFNVFRVLRAMNH